MSKKTLNTENLAALGAERLAALLMEVSTGSADIKRRLRLELSHNLGPEELARDVRKRLVSIRRSKSRVGWRQRKKLVKDLSTQAQMILDKIAPDAPAAAFDLLWEFLELAPSVFARVDDSRGEVGEVFRGAFEPLEALAVRAPLVPEELAQQAWEAVQGEMGETYAGIISVLAPALGETGLAHLKGLVEGYEAAPLESDVDPDTPAFLRELRTAHGRVAAEKKARLVQRCLQEIAMLQGDTDTYVAQFSQAERARPVIAADIAARLLEEDRASEALGVLEAADLTRERLGLPEWHAGYTSALLALGRGEDAQAHRWARFCESLDGTMLRAHLKALPDFEDVEAEDAAKAHAAGFANIAAALQFFLDWPDLRGAAELVEARRSDLSRLQVSRLLGAADALRGRFPLAAVLLWRTAIDLILHEGKSARYGVAVEHLMDCAAADADIEDYGSAQPHGAYLEDLRARHRHKASFWGRLG